MVDKKKKKTSKKQIKNDWYTDRSSIAIYQRNFLMVILLCSMILLFVGMVYINLISQKKTVDPFVVEIEQKTGIPSVVDQKSKRFYTAQETINNFFVYKYIRARESYEYRDYIYNYFTVVRVLSSGDIFKTFYRSVNKRNENSIVNQMGRKKSIEVGIKSVIDITTRKERIDDVITKQVRISKKIIEKNRLIEEQNKVIVMKYKFANLNLEFEERLVNPLGFQVTFYKINDEFNTE